MEEKTNKKAVKEAHAMSTDKKIIILIITVVLVVALGLFTWFYYSNNLKPVATFDGGGLTASEFSIYYKVFAPQYEYFQYPAEEIPEIIANEAAANKILLLKAEKEGFKLSSEKKKQIDEMFKDEDRIKDLIDDGIDPEKMKDIYYKDSIVTDYINKLKTEYTDEEVEKHLKETYGEDVDMTEYVTRHILFLTIDDYGAELEEDKAAEVKKKAEEALAKALAGEDFAKLAKDLSDDTQTAKEGGLYKVYMDDRTDPAYTEATKNLSEGAITTALVKSSYGYHIIKLDKKNEKGRVSSDNDRLSLAYELISKIKNEVKIDVDKKAIFKIVENITGRKLEPKDIEANGLEEEKEE